MIKWFGANERVISLILHDEMTQNIAWFVAFYNAGDKEI